MSASQEGPRSRRPRSTPLHDAVRDGDLSRVATLLQEGADPDLRADREGITALHEAAVRGRVELVRLLLDHGATVDLREELGSTTPLHRAAAHAPQNDAGVATVELLVARGASVNAQSGFGCTPVHSAAIRPGSRILEALLRSGAEVNLADEEGRTPLMRLYFTFVFPAVQENAELLLRHGAALNSQDKTGLTALMLAAIHGELKWAQFLIQAGADPAIRDHAGHTAADHAAAPPPPKTLAHAKIALHEQAGRPELNGPIWEQRNALAALLRTAEATRQSSRLG